VNTFACAKNTSDTFSNTGVVGLNINRKVLSSIVKKLPYIPVILLSLKPDNSLILSTFLNSKYEKYSLEYLLLASCSLMPYLL
jgi:hypothetical protein